MFQVDSLHRGSMFVDEWSEIPVDWRTSVSFQRTSHLLPEQCYDLWTDPLGPSGHHIPPTITEYKFISLQLFVLVCMTTTSIFCWSTTVKYLDNTTTPGSVAAGLTESISPATSWISLASIARSLARSWLILLSKYGYQMSTNHLMSYWEHKTGELQG